MLMKQVAFAVALFGALAAPAFAQAPTATAPAVQSRPAAVAPAAVAPTAVAPAARPTTKTVNVNTANATELDTLPGIGAARAKVILAERAKGSFKDWADFDKRLAGSKVNTGERAKIKNLVTF